MRILALDSAVARCSATFVAGGAVVAAYQLDLDRGHASVLPVMARDCLRDAGLRAAELDLIAVTVGPGSFTGIRAGWGWRTTRSGRQGEAVNRPAPRPPSRR